jgi:hypothetical protein
MWILDFTSGFVGYMGTCELLRVRLGETGGLQLTGRMLVWRDFRLRTVNLIWCKSVLEGLLGAQLMRSVFSRCRKIARGVPESKWDELYEVSEVRW